MTTTGLGGALVAVGAILLGLSRYLARADIDLVRGFWRLDLSERTIRVIAWSRYAFSAAVVLGGIVLVILAHTGVVADRLSSGSDTGESSPVVTIIVGTFMVATLVLTLGIMFKSFRQGGPARSPLGEKPASVVEDVLREGTVRLSPPGLVLQREAHVTVDGTVFVTRSYAYVGEPDPEAVLASYRSALPAFGWTRDTVDGGGQDGYRKRVNGRSLRYVVGADDRGASATMSTPYYQGLWVR